jgi:N utilization substance protein B
MLNRRILRVKVMQALYSYFLIRNALKEVVKQDLENLYEIDPAKHDFAEKDLFDENKKVVSRLFTEALKHDDLAPHENVEESLKKNVQTFVKRYHSKLEEEKRSLKKKMISEAKKIEYQYIKLLMLTG